MDIEFGWQLSKFILAQTYEQLFKYFCCEINGAAGLWGDRMTSSPG